VVGRKERRKRILNIGKIIVVVRGKGRKRVVRNKTAIVVTMK